MARTKASVGAKVASGKSSKARCCAAPSSFSPSSVSGSGEKSSRSLGGGNPVCPRPTPKWQKSITNFFNGSALKEKNDTSDNEEIVIASSSKTTKKRNIIESDEEDTPDDTVKPVNTVLDETIELQPLTGDDSHKIEEYYPKNGEINENGEKQNNKEEQINKIVKGKGIGKKTNKENVNNNKKNVEKRKSVKRDLNSSQSDDENVKISKKVKVC